MHYKYNPSTDLQLYEKVSLSSNSLLPGAVLYSVKNRLLRLLIQSHRINVPYPVFGQKTLQYSVAPFRPINISQ